MYDVSFFCAVGNPHKQNQDRVSVNGEMLRDGIRHLKNQAQLRGYVADGVGSLFNSGHAAEFVLTELGGKIFDLQRDPEGEIRSALSTINTELIKLNKLPGIYQDSATTLCGAIFQDNAMLPINVGDSEILVIRNNELLRITTPQVLDGEMPNSPITSYLGGRHDHMDIDLSLGDFRPDLHDIIIISTDGLLKAISRERLIGILCASGNLEQRTTALFTELCASPAPDNLGAVFIESPIA